MSTTRLSRFQYYKTATAAFLQAPRPIYLLRTPPPKTPLPTHLVTLDASFNPPTIAHRNLLRSALTQVRKNAAGRVDALLLLAVQNADKGVGPAGFEDRLVMMEEMMQEERKETGKEGELWIAVTDLALFYEKAVATDGVFEGVDISWVMGYDTLVRFLDPKYYPDGLTEALSPFFRQNRLLIAARGETEIDGYLERLASGELKRVGGQDEWARRMEVLNVQGVTEGVSSTVARGLAGKKDWKGLENIVAKGVAEWVQERDLYSKEATSQ